MLKRKGPLLKVTQSQLISESRLESKSPGLSLALHFASHTHNTYYYLFSICISFHAPQLQGPATIPLVQQIYSISLFSAFIRFVLSAQALIQCHEKKSRIPGRYPELAQNSSCLLFQLPLQHSSQQYLTGFPKPTRQVVWTALCHSSPPTQIPLMEM